jgi:hypothetical protein
MRHLPRRLGPAAGPVFFETFPSISGIIPYTKERFTLPSKEITVMQFTRRLWIAALCLFVGASAAPAQQIKVLPADTELIFTINIQQMLKSEVAKEYKILIDLAKGKIEEALEDKGLAKHLKKADFDLFRDLASITVAVPGERNPEEGFILLEGKFDAEKIEAAVTDASKEAGGGVKVIKIAGITAFEVAPKDEKTMYVALLDDKTMVACASRKDVESAVARQRSAKPEFKAAVVKNLVSTVNAKQSLSMIATSKVLGKLAENAPMGGAKAQQAVDFLKTMDGFSFAVTIQKDIDFQVGVNAKDGPTAQKYADAANLGLAFVKMKVAEKAKEDPKLKFAVDVVNSVRVTAQGPNLMIRGQMSFEALQKLMENLPLPKS